MVDVTVPAEPASYPEVYLGDGVYASFDGYQIWLDTRPQSPVQRIALDVGTLNALFAYANQIWKPKSS